MPCRSDYMEPTPAERKETQVVREKFENLGDRVTYAADVLREYLLGNKSEKDILPHINYDAGTKYAELRKKSDGLYVGVPEKTVEQVKELVQEYIRVNSFATRMEPPTKKQLESIEKAQVKHREADLRRLMKTLGAAGERELLKKVLDADNTKPLEPQLGFSPDAY